jgi:hypothetical protein
MSHLVRFLRAEWDRVAGYGCVLAGGALLVAGFVGVRTSPDVIDEISYLVTGGIGSVFLLGVGATLLLSADLHDDFRKLHRVEEKLDRVERLLLAQHPELIDAGDVPPVNGGPAPGAPATRPVRRARLFAGIGMAVGAVLLVAGALRTGHQASTDHMAGSVGVALAGALVVALVAAVMVAQLRATVEHRKAAVFGAWLDGSATGGTDAAFTAVEAAAQPVAAARAVFVVPGLPFYHRPGCPLLADRTVTRADPANPPAGTSPCRLCEPA